MKIGFLSDLHGHLPEIPHDFCDLLLLGGDYCGDHRDWTWYHKEFKKWINSLCSYFPVVGIAGNHDIIFERHPELIPSDLQWTYLRNSSCIINNLKIWGSPYTRQFCNWAFMTNEENLSNIWKQIPDDTDIVLTHSPPYGIFDWAYHGQENIGSPSLLERIYHTTTKLHVFGHNHSPGILVDKYITFANASCKIDGTNQNTKHCIYNNVFVLRSSDG